MDDTGLLSRVLATIAAGGQPAIVAAICWLGLAVTMLVRQAPRLAPLVTALRGQAASSPSAVGEDHAGEPDYDTPLDALRMLAAVCRQPAIAIDPDGRIAVFNRAAEDLTGYAAEEMLGASVTLLMGETDARRHPHHVAAYFTDQASGRRPRLVGQCRTVTLFRRDGSRLPVRLDLSHINNGWKGLWAWAAPAGTA